MWFGLSVVVCVGLLGSLLRFRVAFFVSVVDIDC